MRSVLIKIFMGLLLLAAVLFLSLLSTLPFSQLALSSERIDVAPWIDSRNNQEWRLLSSGARWRDAGRICRKAKMRLPRIELLQDVHLTLLSVSVGRKALEVSELAWSADSWSEPSASKSTAVALSLRSGENTSVDRKNLLPVICVREIASR